MKVYMGGLIYLTGCGGNVRAYAPKATGHHASLWIEGPSLNEAATQWWPGLRHPGRDVDGVALIEFKIPERSVIQFPGAGNVQCVNIEDGLPKLKMKKKKGRNLDPNAQEADFHVDPATAQTNAEVEMYGGTVTPRRLGKRGLIEWTITDPAVTIVVASRDNPGDSRTITVTNDQAAVMFLNAHDLPDVHHEKDVLRGEHVVAFKNLNPDPTVGVYPVAAKVPGSVGQLTNIDLAHVKFLKNSGCSCGAATPCCC